MLRERLPGVPVKKLHKLLYYCQGHHLATFGRPLFAESVSAWDMGPVVGQLWKTEHEEGVAAGTASDDEAALNTIGYVVSRYGRLSGLDLEHLTHSESPWRRADQNRVPGGSQPIRPEWMADYFQSEADQSEVQPQPSADLIRAWLADAPTRRERDLHPDHPDALRRRLLDAG